MSKHSPLSSSDSSSVLRFSSLQALSCASNLSLARPPLKLISKKSRRSIYSIRSSINNVTNLSYTCSYTWLFVNDIVVPSEFIDLGSARRIRSARILKRRSNDSSSLVVELLRTKCKTHSVGTYETNPFARWHRSKSSFFDSKYSSLNFFSISGKRV